LINESPPSESINNLSTNQYSGSSGETNNVYTDDNIIEIERTPFEFSFNSPSSVMLSEIEIETEIDPAVEFEAEPEPEIEIRTQAGPNQLSSSNFSNSVIPLGIGRGVGNPGEPSANHFNTNNTNNTVYSTQLFERDFSNSLQALNKDFNSNSNNYEYSISAIETDKESAFLFSPNEFNSFGFNGHTNSNIQSNTGKISSKYFESYQNPNSIREYDEDDITANSEQFLLPEDLGIIDQYS